VAALSTVTPAGYPQTSVVWCDFDGQCVRVNTMRGFAKERNMRRNPLVTLLCYDPRQPLRYLEVRGLVAEMTGAGAPEHLDCLASRYAGQPVRFFGDVLLTRQVCGVFTTLGRDGQPQSTLVWVDLDCECALVNTTLERQKGHNLVRNPKVSLLVVDPGNTSRYLQIRGDAELVTKGAQEHLDALTRKYTSHPACYGYLYPEAQRLRETRVICRIHPRRITLDAIHSADH
jgi:PPOX class probable F420-dependent enzyme